MDQTELARDGGTPVRSTPLPSVMDASGRRFGDEDVKAAERVLRSGMLSATWGTEVPALEQEFARSHIAMSVSGCSGPRCVRRSVNNSTLSLSAWSLRPSVS